ncbi:competence type IV pilus major pilin ComGC [Desulfosporosinus sp. SYSU MS00001]|uniref:competence type IV pilus major pilin ComGC n=1 Tax=Desulfosporosinus sp. SYSU MS00001 TaxID=3416284 RepID=UPI003CE76527
MNRMMTLKRVKNVQMGFTLWELMIVLCLMGVLLGKAVPHFYSSSNFVRLEADLANREEIEGAAQLYRIDIGTFPVSVSDLVNLPDDIKEWRGPYLPEIPVNPLDPKVGYQIDNLGQVITINN